MTQPARNADLEHLHLLGIFHFVLAGVVALVSLLPLIHFVIGVVILFANDGDDAAPLVGLLLIGVASFIIVLGETLALCLALAGRSLMHRRN